VLKDLIGHILDIIDELLKQEEVWLILLLIGFGGVFAFLSGFNLWAAFLRFLELTWWFWLFLILAYLFHSLWLFWRRSIFGSTTEWLLMELRIPREIEKTPKVMEQVLLALYGLRNTPSNPEEKYVDGEFTRPISFEVVSFGGEIHFYVRFYHKIRSLVEAAFFSNYPDVELVEVDEDYMDNLPQTTREIYEQDRDMWATELLLAKEPAYPIKTYPYFIHEIEEARQIDPIGTLLEVLSQIKPDEFVGVQILVSGVEEDWCDEWDPLVEKLKEAKVSQVPQSVAGDLEAMHQVYRQRSPGETDILERIEENLSKPAFETVIRYIYVARREGFYDSFARRGLKGSFNQYSALSLNSFKDNVKVWTMTKAWYWPHIFPKRRAEYKKKRLLYNYLNRSTPTGDFMGKVITSFLFNWNFNHKSIVLNTESVATIFHPPTATVLTAPHVPRVVSRRAGPPAGMAIFGDEEEVEKYKEDGGDN
jgi:hypothetical protein